MEVATTFPLRNIEILPNVVTSLAINRCLFAIDPHFIDLPCTVTSGVRTKADQMRIIIEKVKKYGIDKLYPEWTENEGKDISVIVPVGDQELYWWQRGWSKLLNIQEIVNPPIPAEVLFDYIRPGDTINRKGRIIGVGPHYDGNSFDLSGNDIHKIGKKIDLCFFKPETFIKGYLIEVVNNCCHIDVVPV